MGRHFKHFTGDQREELARRKAAGESVRKIATALGCSASSVSREVRRNKSAKGYGAIYADQQAKARRWCGSRLSRDEKLQALVLEKLKLGWSPQIVSKRLAREGYKISYESIYRFIYAQIRATNDGAWRHYLPRAKSERGRRARKSTSAALSIKRRISLEKRPAAAADRRQAGHWEADLMLFAKYGQAVLVLHERHSRLTALVVQPDKSAYAAAFALHELLSPLPHRLRRTITFDNGTEFALHFTLTDCLGTKTYFCDPHAPWQKGGVENAIGRCRRWLPRRTDLSTITAEQIFQIARLYNHTPRRCLGYRTPAEVFAKLLHFKCETTSRPAPG